METPLSPFTFAPKPDWFEQYKYYLLAALLVVLAVGLYLILTPATTLPESKDTKTAGDADTALASVSDSNGQIVIDIAGGIKQPGVYWLNAGSITEDAIKAAGGFSKTADLGEIGRTINRAQELANHGKVYIPKIGDKNIAYVSPTANASSSSSTGSPININSADNAELDLLPGIGEVLSQRIVDYRLQNNGFKSIDELQKVPGIGDKLFGQLKDLVTI